MIKISKILPLVALALSLPLAANAYGLLWRTYFDNGYSVTDKNAPFPAWTIVDANNDGHTWTYTNPTESANGRTYYDYSNEKDADDWLISPVISVAKDEYITLDMSMFIDEPKLPAGSVEVFYGSEPKASAMTHKLGVMVNAPETKGDDDVYYDFLLKLKAGESIYLGLHANSKAGVCNLSMRTIKVRAYNCVPTAIKSPVSGDNLSDEPVTMTITNLSEFEGLSGGYVYYMVDDDEKNCVYERMDNDYYTLPFGKSLDYTFRKKADFSKPGKHKITVGVMDYEGKKKLGSMSVIVDNSQPSSVSSVTESTGGISLNNNIVSVPKICPITVYDASGHMVLSAVGTKLDISILPKGVYIVKAGRYKNLKLSK